MTRALGGAAAVCLVAALSCLSRPESQSRLSPHSLGQEWVAALTAAQRSVLEGRYDDADRTLATFASTHPASPETRECAYWRGVFLLDPANHGMNLSAATTHLGFYLADSTRALHVGEARILRRLAASLDSLQQLAATSRKAGTADAELTKENQRLKDQLDKTTAELDRIKRRLASPRP
ncbi:MAG: hypothetical protein M3068_07490 [Gemmatimonadota bacterium]|nr:hypothetical protein [Gemmatimonadota bacterium]